jgi:hypothetical protein
MGPGAEKANGQGDQDDRCKAQGDSESDDVRALFSGSDIFLAGGKKAFASGAIEALGGFRHSLKRSKEGDGFLEFLLQLGGVSQCLLEGLTALAVHFAKGVVDTIRVVHGAG